MQNYANPDDDNEDREDGEPPMRLSGDLPTVLSSVEILTREFDSKLLLALLLVSQGCRAIIGHKEAISAIGRSSQRVLWQGKDAFSSQLTAAATEHFADQLHARGSSVMFVQDEGAIFHTKGWTQSLLRKYRAPLMRERRLARICAWGERQKNVLEEHGVASPGSIAVTGSPRFDLCSARYEWIKSEGFAQARARRRPFILMLTRFGSVAHHEGLDWTFRMRNRDESVADADLRLSKWQRDAHDLADYIVLVKEIAQTYRDYDVIVRPHPSEDTAFYNEVFAPYDLVAVTKEGSALDWIRAADLVIHANCTAGVEAVIAGRPVLNMRPDTVPRDDLDKEVAKEAGVSANSISDAVEKAGILLKDGPADQVWSGQAHATLANLNSDSVPKLVDETLDLLKEERIHSSRIVLPPKRSLHGFVRQALGRGTPSSYIRSKRGPLDINHIEMVMDGFGREGGGRGRIRHITPEYVVIEPD